MLEREKSFPLAYPVEFDGETVGTITLRRARVREMRMLEEVRKRAGDDEIGLTVAMLAILAGVPEALIEELDAEDYITLGEAVADFLPGQA